MKRLLLLCAAGLVGCGGGSNPTAAPRHVQVDVHADRVGVGCFQSPIVGGDTLTAEDDAGRVVDTSSVVKVGPSCVWQAGLTLPHRAFYRLLVDDKILTVVRWAQVKSGTLRLHVETSGRVTAG